MSPNPVLPGPAEPVTGRYAARGSASFPAEELRKKPSRSWCALCAYYDPERAYCLYVHTPAGILFVCPRVLDQQE
ncbi:hypothetical protein FGU65_02250 [Methanoculleus sp. FWC-SCC1]|uniref:Uncharacterized protein n=1 Tax=Methanoculleus frigidifontis TaxID=2584085 RepID=A0ABT8M713_9EURY|nr:hypothetical protein [Methanoculleus sp. FWC-SCC1]MDN7023727.1 hypothetical protein [Methanoculleus sp. FWC-SCC1]